MDNKQARKTGRVLLVCGCVFIVLTKVWIGMALIAAALLFTLLLGRCPHCGRIIIDLEGRAVRCPKCHQLL